MTKVYDLIKAALEESSAGGNEIYVGGAQASTKRALAGTSYARLLQNLELARKNGKSGTKILVAAHFLIFGFACAAAWHLRDDTPFLAATLTGGTGVLWWLIVSLRNSLKERYAQDILLAILPDLDEVSRTQVLKNLLDSLLIK